MHRALVLPLTATLLCAACEAGTPAPAPRILFDSIEHDVGRVDPGQQVTDTFTFRNGGGRNLTIEMLRASCDDSAVVEPGRTVAPGDSARLLVTLKADRSAGPCAHTVTVYANDPAQPVTNLKLHADVIADISATPSQLYVGHLRRGDTARFDIALALAEAVRVTGLATSAGIIDARADRSANQRQSKVQIAIRRDAPLGRFADSLIVRTNSSRQPELTVPITGFVDEAGS